MSFKENYTQKVLPEIAKELDIKNPMQLPMIEKVVVNMGIGSYVASGHKDFSSLKNDLALITGQLPRVNHARKSVSNFKLREGMPVGMMVTLRGQRMYDFLEKLIAVVLFVISVVFLQNLLIKMETLTLVLKNIQFSLKFLNLM